MADENPIIRILFPQLQQDHELEARIFSIYARAGVSCIGIQPRIRTRARLRSLSARRYNLSRSTQRIRGS
jgi:hypothetical protein